MKKKFDYQFVIWLFVIGVSILTSSCSDYQSAKVHRVGGNTVSIIDVDKHISVGDTIESNKCHCRVVVVATYPNK